MSLTFPPPGRLSHIPQGRLVTLPQDDTRVPPNVTALSRTGTAATFITLPNGTDVTYGSGMPYPISLKAVWPKTATPGFGGFAGDYGQYHP